MRILRIADAPSRSPGLEAGVGRIFGLLVLQFMTSGCIASKTVWSQLCTDDYPTQKTTASISTSGRMRTVEVDVATNDASLPPRHASLIVQRDVGQILETRVREPSVHNCVYETGLATRGPLTDFSIEVRDKAGWHFVGSVEPLHSCAPWYCWVGLGVVLPVAMALDVALIPIEFPFAMP
jgi:hypothetical protein